MDQNRRRIERGIIMTHILVMGRNEIENIKNLEGQSAVVISICDPNQNFIKLNFIPKNIIYEKFYDIDETITTLDGLIFDAISDDQAKNIAHFAIDNYRMSGLFIVQCEAGISRSAGVAGAILKYFTDDDSMIFNSRRYCPNRVCYRKVLNELYNIKGICDA